MDRMVHTNCCWCESASREGSLHAGWGQTYGLLAWGGDMCSFVFHTGQRSNLGTWAVWSHCHGSVVGFRVCEALDVMPERPWSSSRAFLALLKFPDIFFAVLSFYFPDAAGQVDSGCLLVLQCHWPWRLCLHPSESPCTSPVSHGFWQV